MDPQSGNNDDLRSKFEDFEYTPREEVWDRVQQQQVANASEPGALSPVFAGYAHAPRKQVWDRIVGVMHPGRRRRVVVWWSAAASLALLAVIGLALLNPADSGSGLPKESIAHTTPNDGANNSLAETGPTPEIACPDMQPEPPKEGEGALFANQVPVDSMSTNSPQASPKLPAQFTHQPIKGQQNGRNQGKGLVPNLPEDRQVSLATLDIPQEMHDYADSMPSPEYRYKAVTLAQKEQPAPLQNLWEELPPLPTQAESKFAAALASNFSSGGVLINKSAGDAAEQFNDGGGTLGLSSDVPSNSRGEEFSTPLMLGARMDVRLSKKLNLSTGPVYTRMISTPGAYASQEGNARIVRDFLGLVVEGRYTLIQGKRIGLYSGGGLRYDLGLQQTAQYNRNSNDPDLLATSVRQPLGSQAAISTGAGLNYGLSPKLGLYAQGDLLHYFYQSEFTLWSTKSIWPTLQIGLRLQL